MYTEGEALYFTMAVKRSCVLCTYKEEPAYRLFPSENSEALPNTTMPSSVDFLKSAKMFLKSLLYKECK
jgi:hypothetical protein